MYISTSTLSSMLTPWNPRIISEDIVFYMEGYRVYLSSSDKDQEKAPQNTRCVLLIDGRDALAEKLPQAAGFVIAGLDVTGAVEFQKKVSVPVITVDEGTPLSSSVLPRLIEHYMGRMEEGNRFQKQFLSLMADGSSLQNILQAATRQMENPFIAYDNNYALVAHSVPRTLQVPAAQNVVCNGYANVDIITEMEREGMLDYAFSNQKAPVLVKIINGYEKLAVSIYDHEDYMGLLCFFNYVRPICEEDYERVAFIGELARIYYHNHLTTSNNWTPWDFLFSTALQQEKFLSEESFKRLEITVPPQMRLITICVAGQFRTMQGTQLKYLQTRIRQWLPSCHQYLYNGYLICLDRSDVLNLFPESNAMKLLREELEKLGMVCGVSNPFFDIQNLRTAFYQAAAAVQLGQKQTIRSNVFEYKRLMVPHLMSLLEEQHDTEEFYDPALKELIRYDEEYHTNYLEFLIVYLFSGKNANRCAECFGIHYNSVKYRINVIQEIVHVNLKNLRDVVRLYVAAEIYLTKHPDLLKPYEEFLEEIS